MWVANMRPATIRVYFHDGIIFVFLVVSSCALLYQSLLFIINVPQRYARTTCVRTTTYLLSTNYESDVLAYYHYYDLLISCFWLLVRASTICTAHNSY